MTPACQPHPQRCVLTMHEVQSIKDLIFVVGGNSESSAQKAIFEILADGIRKATAAHTSAPAPDTPASKHNRTSKMNWDGNRCVCNEFFNCHDCRDSLQFNKEHDAQVAKAEREEVLDEVIAKLHNQMAANWTPHREGLGKAVILVESLRHQQEAEQPKEGRR